MSTYEPGYLGFTFDPFAIAGSSVPEDQRDECLQEVQDYVLDAVKTDVNNSMSPVNGRDFRALSDHYAALKKKEVGHDDPDLEFSGDMLDALNIRSSGDVLELYIAGGEAEKADGHCKLTGRDNPIPKRRFIPGDGESFRPEIRSGIKDIVSKYVSDNMSPDDEMSPPDKKSKTLTEILGSNNDEDFFSLG